MRLKKIYRPVEKELAGVNAVLRASLSGSKNGPIAKINKFLLGVPGKRLRPALVVLSANLSLTKRPRAKHPAYRTVRQQLLKAAAALELIHTASLVHDDIIDHADLRHHQPTINHKWGQDVAIASGDYLYTEAFRLIAQCGNPDILSCVSQATKLMCEGELQQVCQRDNLGLLKKQYLIMVKKKTAVLFAASCHTGAIMAGSDRITQEALKEYGLNFGIAFQMMDDCLDLIASEAELGKKPGADFEAGELTLPILNLLESVPAAQREKVRKILASRTCPESFKKIKSMFFDSRAVLKTQNTVLSFIALAKDRLSVFPDSAYKRSLFSLADFITRRGFENN